MVSLISEYWNKGLAKTFEQIISLVIQHCFYFLDFISVHIMLLIELINCSRISLPSSFTGATYSAVLILIIRSLRILIAHHIVWGRVVIYLIASVGRIISNLMALVIVEILVIWSNLLRNRFWYAWYRGFSLSGLRNIILWEFSHFFSFAKLLHRRCLLVIFLFQLMWIHLFQILCILSGYLFFLLCDFPSLTSNISP